MRMPPAWLSAPGSFSATSFYDTRALKETLLEILGGEAEAEENAEISSIG